MAGDHKGVVWQQCGSGLGDDPPVRISPDASLPGILAWAERLLGSSYSFLRDSPKPNPGTLYPSGVQAAMPEPSHLASALSVQLTRADKDALDLLAAWPLCTREQLAGLMGGVTQRRVNQVLRSLSQRGLVQADGPLHVLTDEGLTYLARRDRAVRTHHPQHFSRLHGEAHVFHHDTVPVLLPDLLCFYNRHVVTPDTHHSGWSYIGPKFLGHRHPNPEG